MSTTSSTTRSWGRRALIASAIAVLFATLFSTAASATGRFTAKARMHAAESVTAAVRVQLTATATASAGSPAVRARVTVRVWASATGRASSGAWATARRTAGSPAQARAAARSAAHRKALHRARARATALARARALVSARAIGQREAQLAAQRAAAGRARTLARTRSTTGSTTTSTPPAGCTSLPKAGGGTWQCTFDDEFNGTSIDRTKWQALTSAATGTDTGGTCFVDSPNNASVAGGVLSLTVRKLAAPMTCSLPGGKSITTSYTGGQIGTYTKFAQMYGRFAVRAKFPAAVLAGLQSSLWMWPENTPGGEIDIAEWYSQYPDRVIPYLHYAYPAGSTTVTSTNPLTGTNVVTNTSFLVNDVNAFHEYAVEWTPTTIKITVDGNTVLDDTLALSGPSPFDQPFFMILTACLGTASDALTSQTPLPATTQVDWVRAWK